MGLLEDAYEATNREDDERILIAALSSMDLRTDVRETVLTVDPSVFYNQVHGTIWTAARTLAADDRLMLFDNFKPLLGAVGQRKLQELFGRPVRLIELTTAVDLVLDAAKRRQLVNGLKQIAAVTTTEDEYSKALSTAHTVIGTLETGETSDKAVTIDEALEEMWEQVDAGPITEESGLRLPSAWSKLNESYLSGGNSRGELIVWGAESGGGKSVALMQQAAQWAMAGYSLAIFSLEMSKTDVLNRMVSSAGQVRIADLARRNVDESQLDTLRHVSEQMRGKNVQIFDDADMSMSDIWRQCALMKRTRGLDAVIFDYIQIVRPDNPAESSRERQVSEIMRVAKVMVRSLDVVGATATQLNANSERPNKDSTRESKAIVHHSDLVLFLHHEVSSMGDKTGMVDMIVAKNRRGPEGSLQMVWNPHISRISEN